MQKIRPEIRVKFMGYSSVSLEEKVLTFPYLKVKLLFFIILESRMITRERLCCLLWDNDDDKGHRNLSNALTRLRHILPAGCLNTDRRTVSVNPEWPVVSDLTPLDTENLKAKDVPALLAPFLEDIDFMDPCFAWVQARRRYYREKLSSLLKYKLLQAEGADKIFWQIHIGHLERLEHEEEDFDVTEEIFKREDKTEDETSKKLYDGKERLTPEESDFLDCVAVFKTEAPFEDLKRLSQLDDRNLLRLYEILTNKKILKSRQNGEGCFTILFANPCLQRKTCEKMPDVKRWNLNHRLTALLRKRLKNRPNRKDFGLLVYYARECGETMTALEAEIQGLRFHFELVYELFPILNDAELASGIPPSDDLRFTEDALDNMRSTLDKLIRHEGRTERLIDFERMLLILQSGFLRWTGQYVDALNCLEEAMRLAFASSDWTNNVLEVLEQLCYLGIQKDDASILRRYVFHFYRQALLQHVHPRVGMALRFLAVLNIMEARYGTAEKLLDMSIRLFEKLETRGNVYTLSIIAAVQYKGDIALHQGDHKAAFDFYLRCVRLCDGKEFFKVQCLHLAKLAWCAARLWRLNDVKKYVYCAASYLDAAQNSLGAYAYGGEVIFALSALLKIKEGNFPQAALDLRKAIAISTIIQKPFWNALFFCLLALLKKHADHIVTKCLSGTSDYYWNESKRLFGFLCLDREVEAYAQLEQLLWEDKNCRDNN